MTSFRLPAYLTVFVFLLLGWVGSLPADAANKIKQLPTPDKRVLVTAVDMTNKQITLTNKVNGQTHVYNIDDFTQVTIENSPGTLKDIKVGQQAFSYIERDGSALDSITVGKADPAPVQPKG